MQAIKGAGFTQVGQLTAPPVAATAVYYGADYADVAGDVAALLGVAPRPGCSRPPESPASRSTWAATSLTGRRPPPPLPQLPKDIVNQTAGDTVCQQANPALITRCQRAQQ